MTLHQQYDNGNLFAKIIRGELPCVKIYEDDEALAFMDIFPQAEGHALVIPKRAEATGIFDIEEAQLSGLIGRVQKIAKAVEMALSPDGMRIIQFNGSEAGQTVFHIHFHIVPVYAGKSMKPHAGDEPANAAHLEDIAKKIKSAL